MNVISEHRYSIEERRRQLDELKTSIGELITVVETIPEVAEFKAQYVRALEETNALLREGFNQEQLSQLSRSVPDVFPRHKDWSPPLEKLPDGRWQEPPWYVRLESKLQPVLKAAESLRVLGYY